MTTKSEYQFLYEEERRLRWAAEDKLRRLKDILREIIEIDDDPWDTENRGRQR